MLCGCFIAQEYQYLNLGSATFFFFNLFILQQERASHGRRRVGGAELNLRSRNKHRHLASRAADACRRAAPRGASRMKRGSGGTWGGRGKTPAVCSPCTNAVICSASSQTLPSLLLSGPGPENRCTREPHKSSIQTETSRINSFLGRQPETLVTSLYVCARNLVLLRSCLAKE